MGETEKSESVILRETMLAASESGWTLWRNNVGQAWQGASAERVGSTVVVRNARPIHAGLCVGSSDLIGLVPVIVTITVSVSLSGVPSSSVALTV